MDCFSDICFLCLKNNTKVQSVLFQDTDGIVVNEKLRCFFPEIIDSTPDAHKLSCSECLEKLRISYDFKQSVIRNNTIFRDYIEKLQCHHKSHQQLARLKHRTNLPVARDDTAKKVENCSEKYDSNRLKYQNENRNLTSSQEQVNTHDQSCQLTTNEHDMIFSKFSCQSEEINLKTENIEIEEIFIKEEPYVDDNLSRNYLDEDSKDSEDNICECQFCHLDFSSPTYLQNHIDHCNKKPQEPAGIVTKNIGDDTIPNSNNNSNSTSSHSGNNDERTIKKKDKRLYKCTECPKEFTVPSNLKAHTRVHTGERPFKCDICQKTFSMSNSLNSHKLTHTGEKPHDCDICHKSFNQKTNLITHKRTHDNVRPYQCSVCKKTFTQTSNLTRHMYIHSGQKPYHCDLCQYRSTQAAALKNHMRTHTGERPFICKYCRESFAWSRDLKRHLTDYHKEENA